MNITKLETRRLGESPNLMWVRVHSDQGVVGLGATSYAAQRSAPRVIGRNQELVTHVPQLVRGFFEKPPRPGLGCEPLA
jgi:hypothetical protein